METDLSLKVFVKMLKIHRTLMDRLGALHKRDKITFSQFIVLEALLHKGPMEPCQLVQKLAMSKGNLTMVTGHLVRDGLVTKEEDSTDKRRFTLHLTDQGRELALRHFEIHRREIHGYFSYLNEEEQAVLNDLLRKLGKKGE